MGLLRPRVASTASEGAIAAAAAAEAQALDDVTSQTLHEALVHHMDALAKADIRRVTFLSPGEAMNEQGRWVGRLVGGGNGDGALTISCLSRK